MTTIKAFLKNRALLTLGFSESISNIGNWITMMAVFAMVVFRGDGGLLQSSAIYLAGLLPTLLASPLVGWLVDRVERRRLMVMSELASGLVIAGLFFTDDFVWICVLLALQAVSIAVMSPARQAVLPQLVAREELTRANAFLQQLNGMVKIAAPMLAGGLLTALEPRQAILINVATFGCSALILSRLPLLPATQETTSRESAAQPAGGGGRVLKGIPGLRLLYGLMFFSVLVLIGFDVIGAVYVRDILQGGEALMGLLIGLVGAGTLAAGAFLMLSKRRQPRLWRDILLGLGLLACIPLAFSLAPLLGDARWMRLLAQAGCLAGGVGNGLLVIQSAVLLQTLTPARWLGRAGGLLQSVVVAGQIAGILLTPLLVPAFLNMGTYFLLSALVLALVGVYSMLSLKTGKAGQPILSSERP